MAKRRKKRKPNTAKSRKKAHAQRRTPQRRKRIRTVRSANKSGTKGRKNKPRPSNRKSTNSKPIKTRKRTHKRRTKQTSKPAKKQLKKSNKKRTRKRSIKYKTKLTRSRQQFSRVFQYRYRVYNLKKDTQQSLQNSFKKVKRLKGAKPVAFDVRLNYFSKAEHRYLWLQTNIALFNEGSIDSILPQLDSLKMEYDVESIRAVEVHFTYQHSVAK